MYRAKLDGFTSFRATAVYKLQVNAMPFQCGRLLLYAVPMPTLTTPRESWLSGCVTNAQALHCVQLDIAQQTEVELRIPFISPFNSFDLINGRYPWARVYVMVYSPLNQVEVNELECLLWAHFEDIELGAPTSGVIAPAKQQSGRVKKGAPKEITPAEVKETRAAESTGINIGAISGGAATGWSKVGETIPFVKPVTDIFGGLASAAGSILSPITGLLGGLFGFSKPVLNHSGNTVVLRPTQYFGNIDGNDHSHVLSLMSMNAIDAYPGLGGTTLSETSLEFLKTIPQYVGQFCFGKANNYGDKLWEAYVKPGALAPVDVVVSPVISSDYEVPPPQSVKIPTILNYISSVFAYWTGSLVYTFRFVKTHFHSGRVEISFHPFVENVDSKRMDYVYRLVVDLRDNSEISVAIPYISPTPWKIFNHDKGIFDQDDFNSFSTGKIVVRALTKLVTSSSIAPNNIECLVELRAGSDYRLQAPVKSPWFPIRFESRLTESQRVVPKQQSGNVYAFPGTFETRSTAVMGKIPSSISGIQSDIERESPEMQCAGEVFEDFQAITRRFAFVEIIQGLDPDNCIFRDAVSYVRPPALQSWSGIAKDGYSPKYFFKLEFQPSPLSYVAGMYAFFRGSLRLKVYSPQSVKLTGCQLGYRPWVGYYAIGNPTDNFITPNQYEQSDSKKFAEFQIPYYSPTIITVPYPQETAGKLFTQPQVTAAIGFNSQESVINVHLAVAAGDDMSFHMFLGVPPVMDVSMFKMTWVPKTPADAPKVPILDNSDASPNPCFQPVGATNPLSGKLYKPNSVLTIENVTFKDLGNLCSHVKVFDMPIGLSSLRIETN